MPRYFTLSLFFLAIVSCAPETVSNSSAGDKGMSCGVYDEQGKEATIVPCDQFCAGHGTGCTALTQASVVYGAAAPLPQ
jgi:hypothetical protein